MSTRKVEVESVSKTGIVVGYSSLYEPEKKITKEYPHKKIDITPEHLEAQIDVLVEGKIYCVRYLKISWAYRGKEQLLPEDFKSVLESAIHSYPPGSQVALLERTSQRGGGIYYLLDHSINNMATFSNHPHLKEGVTESSVGSDA